MKHLSLIATTISCIGGFLFGYDIGVISGVLAMPTFPPYFGMQGDPATVATMKGNIVSLLQAGCCAGALLVNFLADPLGRRWTIVLSSFVFIIGSILQVAAQNLETMLAGRFFGGMGIGACSMLVPMYVAEIAPRKLRGRLGTLWQFLIVIGIMLSYWVDYGCLRHIPVSNTQWRVPLGIQIAPGGILCIGMVFLPESLRWLAQHGRTDDVLKNLCRLRDLPADHPEILQELKEIEDAAELDRQAKSGKWTELFQRENLHRLFIGIMLQIFQQWTGSNAINYYGPDIFKSIGLDSNETEILATGVYGAVKVAFVFVTFFFVDTRLGRRHTLMMGSVIMMVSFFVLGGAVVGAKGYIAMVCIYIFAIGYECSWGPIVWIVCSEIYPTRLRAISLSITTAFNWAMNATLAKVTPIMMTNITYGTYFFFGAMAVIMGVFAYVFLPETRGRSLEEIDAVRRKKR
ncbi:general substrate transporter [Rhizopus microsporus ATCC 52813]|uniref:General substrate transporter n=1 Tax=Rhizopus microsporus ATCC 52813 TaxID=1340429 RepID=A0A2G4T000_RHIZD|nr:general substrate transporter [Rhizopus microsporus ATCC 52813]PHZ14349.1 general substrate transporter [Rhizopus microsporus ATCC 52813]